MTFYYSIYPPASRAKLNRSRGTSTIPEVGESKKTQTDEKTSDNNAHKG